MNRSSVVSSNVDLAKVEAINQKRTLAFINHWVLHTVGFLNQFSSVCEERLILLSTKLRRADQSLAILEAKLNSVPDLEGVVAAPIESNSAHSQIDTPQNNEKNLLQSQMPANKPPSSEIPITSPEVSAPNRDEVEVETTEEEVTETIDNAPSAVPVSKDPRFASYFKMLAVGVPLPAVKMKMTSEGLNPSILDDPHAPAPPPDQEELHDDSDSSSVSSFSD